MKLYYVPKAPLGVRWQGTQADAKTTGKTFASEFIQREVPVDKPNLLQFLNAEEQVARQQDPVEERPLDELEQAEERAVSLAQHTKWGRGEIEDDGHPAVRSAYTPAQVACASLPSSPVVQDVCHIIAKMGPAELGFVALEVVARGAVLGGVSRNYNAGASKGIDDGR